jgi:SAM-dependent methyltransferase
MNVQLPPIADKPIPDHIDYDDHWWFASRTRMINRLMQQVLPVTTGLKLLDIGCGAGNMIHHLSRYGQVKGLEVDARPVREARLRGYDVDLHDASKPYPFEVGTFDVVTAFDVIEHIKDDVAVLKEAYRVLKPGGHIVVTVPAFMWLWSHNDDINAHERRYNAADLKTKLQGVGFELKRVSYNNYFVFPMAAALILLRKGRGNKPELASHHLNEDEFEVEMEPASPLVNKILTRVGEFEAEMAGRISFPFGTSLIAVARKPM